MDTIELSRLCLKDSMIARSFLGVFACDLLPNKITWPSCLIANTKESTSRGEHWIGIFINKEGYGDYFCSYGQPPSKVFVNFLNAETRDWNYSRKRLQDDRSTTCGQYATFFIHSRANGLPLSKFLTLFTTNKEENDEIVTAYINGFYNVETVVRKSILFG